MRWSFAARQPEKDIRDSHGTSRVWSDCISRIGDPRNRSTSPSSAPHIGRHSNGLELCARTRSTRSEGTFDPSVGGRIAALDFSGQGKNWI